MLDLVVSDVNDVHMRGAAVVPPFAASSLAASPPFAASLAFDKFPQVVVQIPRVLQGQVSLGGD